VEEEQVPGPRVPDEAREFPPDVGPRGLQRGAVIDEDADAGLVEAEAVDEAPAHASDVVVAPLELRFGARVVDAHQHRPLRPHRCLFQIRSRVASNRRPATVRRGEATRRRGACVRRFRGRGGWWLAGGGALDFWVGRSLAELSIGAPIWQVSWGWLVGGWWGRARWSSLVADFYWWVSVSAASGLKNVFCFF